MIAGGGTGGIIEGIVAYDNNAVVLIILAVTGPYIVEVRFRNGRPHARSSSLSAAANEAASVANFRG